jgi:Ca2+-binding RTX toxin-like protein
MANLKSITAADDNGNGGNDDDLIPTEGNDRIEGSEGRDKINALDGDDWVEAGNGNDNVKGGAGFDVLYGEEGNDKLFGGADIDFVYGGRGDDTLFGDNGFGTAKGSDLSSDVLQGDQGRDLLVLGDGNDVASGGKAADTFHFRWSDPSVELAAGTGRAFTKITDFDAKRDGFQFDVAGVGSDSNGANFIDGGAGDGTAGGQASSFFSGAAANANGEAVVVVTDQSFATGLDAVAAINGEAAGDLVLYFNSTVGTASLLVVDGENAAHSIARLTNIDSVQELQNAGFGANDFDFV